MSFHVINHELEQIVISQRRKSSLVSVAIGLLLITFFALIGLAIGINLFTREVEVIVAYQDERVEEETLEKARVTQSVKKIPSSPSSTQMPIIASHQYASFALPASEIPVENINLDFGDSEGFGDGWGSGNGTGYGSGAGALNFSFMGSQMSGRRVCFVIDYSASMAGKRIKLLKEELAQTISELPQGTEYQLIFFAGPAWVAGSKISNPRSLSTSIVSYKGKSYKWAGKKYSYWGPVGERQQVKWIKMSEGSRKQTLRAIQNTGLVLGTTWLTPLEMAMDMQPKPELVVFLTDGVSGKDSDQIAKRMGDLASSRSIRVNTIALMEPKARKAMAELAHRSGGEFSLIGIDGKKVKQELRSKIKQH